MMERVWKGPPDQQPGRQPKIRWLQNPGAYHRLLDPEEMLPVFPRRVGSQKTCILSCCTHHATGGLVRLIRQEDPPGIAPNSMVLGESSSVDALRQNQSTLWAGSGPIRTFTIIFDFKIGQLGQLARDKPISDLNWFTHKLLAVVL